MDSLLAGLASLLQDSLGTIAPKAKRRRLRCLRLLVDRAGIGLLAKSAAASAASAKGSGGTQDAGVLSDEEEESSAGGVAQARPEASHRKHHVCFFASTVCHVVNFGLFGPFSGFVSCLTMFCR